MAIFVLLLTHLVYSQKDTITITAFAFKNNLVSLLLSYPEIGLH